MPFNLKNYKLKRDKENVVIAKPPKKKPEDNQMQDILPGMQMNPKNQKPNDGTQGMKSNIKPPTQFLAPAQSLGAGFIFKDIPRRDKSRSVKNIKLKL